MNGSILHPSFVEQQDYAVVAEFLENMVSLFMFIQIRTEVKPDYQITLLVLWRLNGSH